MANLVETILSSLPANAGDSLGAMLGDDPDASFKGLAAAVPTLLAAFAAKSAAGGDLGGLLSTITGSLSAGNPLDHPSVLLSGQPHAATGAGGLAAQLFGSNLLPVVAAIAAMFGLKSGTANSLMAIAGPLVIGGIGKKLGGAPSVHEVRNLLASEKDEYEHMLPAELRRLVAPVAPAAAAAPVVDTQTSSGWWKWLLLALAILALLWYIFGRGEPAEMATTEPVVVEPVPAVPVTPAGSGVIVEDRIGKPVLVVFFEVGRSEVSNDLHASSEAVKAYIDSHPDARVSVSGFNDPTGDPVANAELAKNRAEQVKAALVAAGFDEARIDLDKPVDATDTTDSYAAARRVEVTVKE